MLARMFGYDTYSFLECDPRNMLQSSNHTWKTDWTNFRGGMMKLKFVIVALIAATLGLSSVFGQDNEADPLTIGVSGVALEDMAENFKDANIDLYTLSNYSNLLNLAVAKKYIPEEDLITLQEWKVNPAAWKQE